MKVIAGVKDQASNIFSKLMDSTKSPSLELSTESHTDAVPIVSLIGKIRGGVGVVIRHGPREEIIEFDGHSDVGIEDIFIVISNRSGHSGDSISPAEGGWNVVNSTKN